MSNLAQSILLQCPLYRQVKILWTLIHSTLQGKNTAHNPLPLTHQATPGIEAMILPRDYLVNSITGLSVAFTSSARIPNKGTGALAYAVANRFVPPLEQIAPIISDSVLTSPSVL